MENIRASEIRKFKEHSFFGFSCFLMVVLALATMGLTLSAIMTNNQFDSPDLFVIWGNIAAAVIAGIMLIAFLVKKKYVQAILALLFIALNVLLATRVLDVLDWGIKCREAIAAETGESGSSSGISLAALLDSLTNQWGLLNLAVSGGTTILGIVYFVFTIISLRKVRGANIDAALKAKIEDIKAHPENKAMSPKKLVKVTNKYARKAKYVDFCHALGVLCILDDPTQNEKYFIPGESKFTGSVIILGLLTLLWWILNIITLGILIPWTSAWKQKYYAEHTTFSGKKVVFDGKGIQLLGKWILWTLLCIITAGIYGFFMAIALKKWIVKHQHFEDEPNVESEYTGTTFGRGIMVILLRILQAITLGLATPYVENKIQEYDMEHTIISGHPLVFDGTAAKLLGNFLLWILLSIVTIGFYAILVLPMNMKRYAVKHSMVLDVNYDPASDPR